MNSELISFGMFVCNVVQVCALWNISVGTNSSFVLCSPGTGNLLDLWSFGRRLATAQVSVRTGKGRKFLCLFYLYIDLFRVRFVVQKGNVQVCRKL